MRNLLAAATILFALLATVALASADIPTKRPPAGHATARLTVKPGEIVRWRSPNIGPVNTLGLTVAGREAAYGVEPKTHACVAYGYEAGVAVRMTDCAKGRRVPYLRLRAVSAALKPVRVVLRLNGG